MAEVISAYQGIFSSLFYVYPTQMPVRLVLFATHELPSLERIWESALSLARNAEVSQTFDTRQLSQVEIIRVLLDCWALNLFCPA